MPGHHRFVWDLRYERPRADRYEYMIAAVFGEDTPLEPRGPLVAAGLLPRSSDGGREDVRAAAEDHDGSARARLRADACGSAGVSATGERSDELFLRRPHGGSGISRRARETQGEGHNGGRGGRRARGRRIGRPARSNRATRQGERAGAAAVSPGSTRRSRRSSTRSTCPIRPRPRCRGRGSRRRRRSSRSCGRGGSGSRIRVSPRSMPPCERRVCRR